MFLILLDHPHFHHPQQLLLHHRQSGVPRQLLCKSPAFSSPAIICSSSSVIMHSLLLFLLLLSFFFTVFTLLLLYGSHYFLLISYSFFPFIFATVLKFSLGVFGSLYVWGLKILFSIVLPIILLILLSLFQTYSNFITLICSLFFSLVVFLLLQLSPLSFFVGFPYRGMT